MTNNYTNRVKVHSVWGKGISLSVCGRLKAV